MTGHSALLPTKLVVPRLRKVLVPRPGLSNRLRQALEYPLAILSAGPGCGKSTAMAEALAGAGFPHAWYSVGEGDAGPGVFCRYLAAACGILAPGVGTSLPDAVDALIADLHNALSEDALLVLDDYHLVAGVPEVADQFNRFLAYKPARLHVAVLCRGELSLPQIRRWQAQSEVLEIGQAELAFSRAEIQELFDRCYGYRLTDAELDELACCTEGWVMALKMIGHGMGQVEKRAAVPSPGGGGLPGNLNRLFEYLSRDILAREGPAIRSFLLKTSVVDELDQEVCRALLGDQFDPGLLDQVSRKGLFLVELGPGRYRYLPLFLAFLRDQARRDAGEWLRLQDVAARFYLQARRPDRAAEHLIGAERWDDAARLLVDLAPSMIQTGRAQTLLRKLDYLPEEVLCRYPELLVAQGDALRLASSFERAMACYSRAEAVSRSLDNRRGLSASLKGMAQVYLDTIQPAQAEQYLRLAARALTERDPEEKAALLQLMAENKINQGKPNQAQRYLRLVNEMLHEASRGDPDARLLLRTGRLDAARYLLERKAGQEQGRYHPPRSHRETPLLLSLIYSFMGQSDRALAAAEEGIHIGHDLGSPFVEAVGYMRLGHAYQLQEPPDFARAVESYQRALDISDRLGVTRGRAEALMGLCLVHGWEGDFATAQQCGQEGVRVAEQVRDHWFAAVLRLSLGVAAACSGKADLARQYLSQAGENLRQCSDSHGLALSRLWLAHLAHRAGREGDFVEAMAQLLELAQIHGYDFLLMNRTLLGARDPRALIPLLMDARRSEVRGEYAGWLLAEMGLSEIGFHPGYTLRIQTLGPFSVWRGEMRISPRQWQREKARKLFQLLLTRRRGLVHKEQIMDILWPNAEPERAERDFKVALNALMNALEPGRPPRAGSSYIFRQGQAYGFNLACGYWLDADEFESLVSRANQALEHSPDQALTFLRRAVELYRGDYLQDVLYDEWCLEERERLAVMYLKAAETLARLLAERGDFAGSIEWCERILARDNCWEEAYRLQMLCYSRLNNRGMVARVYEKCATTLNRELGVSPSLHTIRMYRRFLGAPREQRG